MVIMDSDQQNKYLFRNTNAFFITRGILSSIVIFYFLGGLCVSAYCSNPHVVILLFAIFWILYPLPLLYCRWFFLKSDRDSTLSVDLETKQMIYKKNVNEFVFYSNDICKWSSYECGTRFISFVEITELTLNTGIKIYIHGGIGNVNYFLRRNKTVLCLPDEEIKHGIKYIYTHLKELKRVNRSSRE